MAYGKIFKVQLNDSKFSGRLMDSYQSPCFAIVLPVFNAGMYLEETLDSILAQTYSNFLVFAVNDFSQDNSLEILHAYSKLDKRIIVINQTRNMGVSASRNKALDQICAMDSISYVTFIDADDVIEHNYLEKISEIFVNKQIEYVVFGIDYLFATGKVKSRFPLFKAKLDKTNILTQYFVSASWSSRCNRNLGLINKAFPLTKIKDIRFNESMELAEDLEFFSRVFDKVKEGFFTSEVLYHYRQRKSSLVHRKCDNYLNILGELHKLTESAEDFYSRQLTQKLFYITTCGYYLRALQQDKMNASEIKARYRQEIKSFFGQDLYKNKYDWLKYLTFYYLSPKVASWMFSFFQRLRSQSSSHLFD